MATRFGTSKKTKRVQLRFLFIQELVASGVVSIKKVAGTWDHVSFRQSSLTSYCTCVEVHTSYVHVCMHVFSTAFPVFLKTLRVDSHGILHFVLVWFCCGLVTSFRLELQGTFRMNFRNFATETAVFYFNVFGPLTSFFCHFTAMHPCTSN